MKSTARRIVYEVVIESRRLSCAFRHLPDFLIIGAQKAGTSSLFAYLHQHPQISGSLRKEVNFFSNGTGARNDGFRRGDRWYRAHFPLRRRSRLFFEATPSYLNHPAVPLRVSKLMPEGKFIAILRDPVDRAVSAYFHREARGTEPLPIMAALEAEDRRAEVESQAPGYRGYPNSAYQRRGEYAQQLERWFAVFPRDRFLILESGALFRDPQAASDEAFAFLGVEPFRVPDLRARNEAKRKSPVGPEVYEHLRSRFRDPNERLFELLGRRFDWK